MTSPLPLYVTFWGTRGSIPTPGRRTQRYGGNTACIELRFGETVFILDGGTGLRELGDSLLARARGKPLTLHLFFSHPHWDHIQGFPFFAPAYLKTSSLYVYGTSRSRTIRDLLSGQMKSAYFPVEFASLGATIESREIGDSTVVEGVKVTVFQQTHPGGSIGYAFEHAGRKLVYSTDIELDLDLLDPSLPEVAPKQPRQAPTAVLDFYQGANLLIADSQWSDDMYEKRRNWGHPRATTMVDAAVAAGVKRLALFHHDPSHSDSEVDRKIDDCRARAESQGSKLEVFGAREGMTLKFP